MNKCICYTHRRSYSKWQLIRVIGKKHLYNDVFPVGDWLRKSFFAQKPAMQEVVDLYARMLIGIFSFIGPSFSLLIPLFSTAVIRSRQQLEESLPVLLTIQHKQVLHKIEIINKRLSENRVEINLLNPLRQVKRIFSSLFIAIVAVLFYYFQKSANWSNNIIVVQWTTLLISASAFTYCIYVLWQIFCCIISIKQQEGEQALPANPVAMLKPKP